MTTREINLLIERYLDGETTPAEERELALAVEQENRPVEWAIIAEMLGELTLDEALYESSFNPSERNEILGKSDSNGNYSKPNLWRGWRGFSWAAAACAIVAFGLSYNIIKEEPQELAKVQHHQPPAKLVAQQEPAKALQDPIEMEAPQKPIKTQPPLLATAETPSIQNLSCDQSHDNNAAPQEPSAPPPEDLALCMALLAEVEAHAMMLQQTQHPPIDRAEESTMEQLLIDELLVNIQQQSNRPELSL